MPPTRQRAVPVMPCRSSKQRLQTALSATSPVQLRICGDVTDAAMLTNAMPCFMVIQSIRTVTKNTTTIAKQGRCMDGNDAKINGDDTTTLRQVDESERWQCFDSANPRMLRRAALEPILFFLVCVVSPPRTRIRFVVSLSVLRCRTTDSASDEVLLCPQIS